MEMDNGASFVGWRGDSFDPQEVFGSSGPVKISEKPLAYVWKNFLSKQEAKHIAKTASRRLKRSMVGGAHSITEVRTSYGMFIPRYYDVVMANIHERISQWIGIPVVHQEDMQVLRYDVGQNYKQHMDANGRMCTLLIYLAETQYGGETAFPSTTDEHWLDPSMKPSHLSNCAEGHVAVKPEVGTALLFYSMPPGAEKNESLRIVDPFSMHTGCPPVEGHKWTSTVWVHFDPFRPESFSKEFKKPLPDPGLCIDQSPQCKRWADQGECTKNMNYMLGFAGGEGHCRLSCNNCTACPAKDEACLTRSRVEQGFIGDVTDEIRETFGD